MKMPMGLQILADIFQREMSKLFFDLDFVLVYIDDVLIVTKGTYEDHLQKLKIVLTRMRGKGAQLNAKKSFFARDEVEYLGYIINKQGLRPQPSKIKAIINMKIPKTVKELRGFVGLVNFYRELWRKRAHCMTPLTQLMSKKKRRVAWSKEADIAFKNIKKICAEAILLFYPDYNEPFIIFTDSSKYQMGAVITQDNKPVAYWSKKLSPTKKRYSTIEQELLAITKLLKENRNMLLGQEIIIMTDHKNLTYANTAFSSNVVLRQ